MFPVKKVSYTPSIGMQEAEPDWLVQWIQFAPAKGCYHAVTPFHSLFHLGENAVSPG